MAAGRRANGEGNILFNSDRNRWEARFSHKDSYSGKTSRRMFIGKTQKEALSKGKKWIQDIENGLHPNSDKITVWEWLETWLTDYVKPNVRIKSYMKYETSLRCYIKPYIGNRPLAKVTALEIQKIFSLLQSEGGKEKKGISPTTVSITRRYLCTAFDKACKMDLLARNVVQNTDAPKQIRAEIQPLNADEVRRLLAISQNKNPTAYIMILLAVSTGVRIGELLGLRWNCVDLDNSVLHIRQTIATNVKGSPFQPPKTAKSRRKIPIPKDIANELIQHKKRQEGRNNNPFNLVITNSHGKPLDSSNFITRIYKPLLKEANLRIETRFHDLRHTHATLLLSKGVHPKVVQERLGHSTIVMTLDTYSHLLPDMQQTAVAALDEFSFSS